MAPKDHPGYAILGESPEAGTSGFYLVLGAPRGGTTLIARALARLGVFMGEKLPLTVEDPFLADMVVHKDWGGLGRTLEERTRKHGRSGWKFPQILLEDEGLEALPVQTRVLLVFRDVAATAIRGTLSNATAFREEARGALRYHKKMLDFVEETDYPALALSYEKLLLRPDQLAEGLGRFVGVGSPELLERVAGVVEPSPSVYRDRDNDEKRKARSAGLAACIDSCDGGGIHGWAFLRADPGRPAELSFRFESGLVRCVRADLPRPDLKEAGLHPTGDCGFRLVLEDGERPLPGDYVEAMESVTGAEFEGSPFVYTRELTPEEKGLA